MLRIMMQLEEKTVEACFDNGLLESSADVVSQRSGGGSRRYHMVAAGLALFVLIGGACWLAEVSGCTSSKPHSGRSLPTCFRGKPKIVNVLSEGEGSNIDNFISQMVFEKKRKKAKELFKTVDKRMDYCQYLGEKNEKDIIIDTDSLEEVRNYCRKQVRRRQDNVTENDTVARTSHKPRARFFRTDSLKQKAGRYPELKKNLLTAIDNKNLRDTDIIELTLWVFDLYEDADLAVILNDEGGMEVKLMHKMGNIVLKSMKFKGACF